MKRKLLEIDWLTKLDKKRYAALAAALEPVVQLLAKPAHVAIFKRRGIKGRALSRKPPS